jgi:hypothetical protein
MIACIRVRLNSSREERTQEGTSFVVAVAPDITGGLVAFRRVDWIIKWLRIFEVGEAGLIIVDCVACS